MRLFVCAQELRDGEHELSDGDEAAEAPEERVHHERRQTQSNCETLHLFILWPLCSFLNVLHLDEE